ncbi:MAG: NADH-quinone oxidoreductase subunit NuoH [Spirochaetia bacterium]|jgi:NADH-quinone oxidoreductase subunit H
MGHFLYDLFYNSDVLLDGWRAAAHQSWAARGWPPVILDGLLQLAWAVAAAVFLALNALFIIWFERKVAARIQIRRGPNRVGPWGILQTLADTGKMLIKEDIIPDAADRAVFRAAPLLVLASTFLLFVVLPFGKGLVPADLNVGLLYFLAIGGLSVIGILAGGWASNNKYSLMGGMRSAAQIVSYEVPAVLTVLSVALLAGSLRMGDIVRAQPAYGYVLLQPLGFLLFLVASNAEINRGPFDLPESDSELVSGFITEYSAMRFAFFFLAEYTNLFLAGAFAATLFLGGWRGPVLPPVVWFLLKSYFVVFILIWVRWTFPRLRVDHLMEFSWKVLLPLALANLLVTAVLVKVL